MRKGKIAAQAAQAALASLGAILGEMEEKYIPNEFNWKHGKRQRILEYYTEEEVQSDLGYWLEHDFTKICVYVNSEEELLVIEQKAKEVGLINCLIKNSGKTEFNGVPTHTVLAVGPARDSRLKPIAGHLPLL